MILEHLKGEITAFREASKEMTREREPKTWANIQKTLGIALMDLGEHENNIALFTEAATAFRMVINTDKNADMRDVTASKKYLARAEFLSPS